MGSRTDVAELLSQCRWSEEGSYLGEIAKSGFPCIAKVIRGQYQNIGQPSFSNPSLVSHVLLVSAGKQLSIAAQCVKFKNCRQRVVPFGPTLAIPQNFEGHFEILSEDGRSVPCIQTVSALSRKFPDSCLVREPVKVYKPDAKSPTHGTTTSVTAVVAASSTSTETQLANNVSDAQHHHSYKISDKSRVVQPGEILVLVGEVSVPSGKKVSRYLRCFDSKGQTVYLSSSQKGKFSPLARQDSISGVHTTKNILSKRMPMMVRLVDGKQPVTSSAKSSSFKFVPELRLFSTIQEELIFGMPLSHSSSKEPLNLLPLPLSVPLKFQVCRNMGQVEQMKEFCRLQEKVKTLVDQTKNLIQIYDINLKKELRFDGRQWKSYAPPIFLSPSTPDILSAANNNHHQQLNLTHSHSHSHNHIANNNNYNEIPDVQDYEDIDQIYDYVRGIKPPPSRIMNGNNDSCSPERKISSSKPPISHSHNPAKAIMIPPVNRAKSPTLGSTPHGVAPPPIPKHRLLRQSVSVEKLVDDDRPEPPPIETIPTNKNKFLINSSVSNGKNVSNVQLKITGSSNMSNQPSQNQNQLRSNSDKIKEMKNNKNKSSVYSGKPKAHHQHPIVTASVNKHTNGNLLINGGSNSSNASPTHILSLSSSNNSSSNNTTPTNTSGSSGGVEKVRGKHLYVKHNSHNNGGGLITTDNCISGSPTNRIIFRRSPIFDCRYKSMNDLNRSSLESGASSASQKLRYFQHNHHGLNVSGGLGLSNLSMNLMNLNMNMKASSARHKGMIFRPKSLTNITLDDGNSGGSCKKKLDMVVPSHHHAIHSPPPPPIELLQKIPRSSQSQRSRKSQPPPTLYL